MKITFLGTGTSQGVPVIACECQVCNSSNYKDKRLRSSVMISIGTNNYVIDSGPDFRQQMLRKNIKNIRALLLTHEHKDHIAGMDDVRAFNYKYNRDIDVFCDINVHKALKREFPYIFSEKKYPGVPRVKIYNIDKYHTFMIDGNTFTPIEVMHYRLPILGFRVGELTYITDAKTIREEEIKKIKGSKVLVVNALRLEDHISHFNLEQALNFINEIKPNKAYLTHISHYLGKHDEVTLDLPENVHLAYDGLEVIL